MYLKSLCSLKTFPMIIHLPLFSNPESLLPALFRKFIILEDSKFLPAELLGLDDTFSITTLNPELALEVRPLLILLEPRLNEHLDQFQRIPP